ncbi:MAG: metallophosphatase domain-containing protein [Saprospiraceae bacterium]|nr:metallophosphatase domain-containing protein [Saprospiraceae bacterium]
MKLVLISDTHARHRALSKLPTGQTIVHAGDFCHYGGEEGLRDFLSWYTVLPYEYKILVAGNHDFKAAEEKETFLSQLPNNIIYLEDQGVEIEGVNFWGSPVQPDLVGMAFGKDRERGMKQHWEIIPEATDVLITHTPPKGILDTSRSGRRLGCDYLRSELERIQPRLHVFGHVHASYGQIQLGPTHFINATSIRSQAQSMNAPISIEI